MYKLIALDLDGTLLNDNHHVSPKNRWAIQKAVEQGVEVVLASARPYRSVAPVAENLGLSRCYVIAAGGSDVRLFPTGQVVSRSALSPAQVARCIDFCDRHGQFFQVFRMDGSYYFRAPSIFSQSYEEVFHYGGQVQDFAKWDYDDCCKIMVFSPDDQIDPVHHAAQKEMARDFLVVKSWYNITEFHPLSGGKAGALRAVAQAAGLRQAQVIAVGDDTIDLPMIQWAGLGVAMGNAADPVKAEADWIAPSNEEDGVAATVEKFILA